MFVIRQRKTGLYHAVRNGRADTVVVPMLAQQFPTRERAINALVAKPYAGRWEIVEV